MPDVTVVGSCNIDMVIYASRMPQPGETLIGHRFAKEFGGKGANQAVAAARMGAHVALVGRVGANDGFGDEYIRNLAECGVDTKYLLRTDGVSTGVASITVADSGENSIVIVPGANLHLSPGDLTSAQELINNSKVVVCQLEVSSATTLAALASAHSHGVRWTILNAAPAQSGLSSELFQNADIVCPNETEAEILTGVSVTDVASAERAARSLVQRGARIGMITLGAQGVVFVSAVQPDSARHVRAPSVDAVDSTGAGDAFVGALAYYLACEGGLSLQSCVERAVRVASISVQRPGTQSSYLPRSELPADLFK